MHLLLVSLLLIPTLHSWKYKHIINERFFELLKEDTSLTIECRQLDNDGFCDLKCVGLADEFESSDCRGVELETFNTTLYLRVFSSQWPRSSKYDWQAANEANKSAIFSEWCKRLEISQRKALDAKVFLSVERSVLEEHLKIARNKGNPNYHDIIDVNATITRKTEKLFYSEEFRTHCKNGTNNLRCDFMCRNFGTSDFEKLDCERIPLEFSELYMNYSVSTSRNKVERLKTLFNNGDEFFKNTTFSRVFNEWLLREESLLRYKFNHEVHLSIEPEQLISYANCTKYLCRISSTILNRYNTYRLNKEVIKMEKMEMSEERLDCYFTESTGQLVDEMGIPVAHMEEDTSLITECRVLDKDGFCDMKCLGLDEELEVADCENTTTEITSITKIFQHPSIFWFHPQIPELKTLEIREESQAFAKILPYDADFVLQNFTEQHEKSFLAWKKKKENWMRRAFDAKVVLDLSIEDLPQQKLLFCLESEQTLCAIEVNATIVIKKERRYDPLVFRRICLGRDNDRSCSLGCHNHGNWEFEKRDCELMKLSETTLNASIFVSDGTVELFKNHLKNNDTFFKQRTFPRIFEEWMLFAETEIRKRFLFEVGNSEVRLSITAEELVNTSTCSRGWCEIVVPIKFRHPEGIDFKELFIKKQWSYLPMAVMRKSGCDLEMTKMGHNPIKIK